MNASRLRITLALTIGLMGLTTTLLLLGLLGKGRSAQAAASPRYAQASSDVFCVTLGGGGPYPGCTQVFTNVQTAVDFATGGETIKVAAGIYTEVQGRSAPAGYSGPSIITQVVYISKTLTIQGGYTTTDWSMPYPLTQPTTLDAQGQGRVLFITGNISPTIESLHITNGNAAGLGDAGGGAYIITATTTISNSQVFSNTAVYGGGLYLNNSGAMLSNNIIFSNTASGGSGGGVYLQDSTATLNGNTVISNTASGNWSSGGGLYLSGSSATLSANIVSNNNTAGSGGGLYLYLSPATLVNNTVSNNQGSGLVLYYLSNAILISNTISNNTADGCGGLSLNSSGVTFISNTVSNNAATVGTGGGLCLAWSSATTLSGNTIFSNTAQHGGGGLYLQNSNDTLVNNVVAGNQSMGNGSGILISASAPRLLHNTIVHNTGGDGSGVYVTGDFMGSPSTVALTNTILVSHTVGVTVTAGNTAVLTATLWGAGAWANGSDWGGDGTVVTGTVNIWGNPAFAADGYHLTANSTARGKGVNAGITTDIDGEPRHDPPDLGADEYSLQAALIVSKNATPNPVQAGTQLTYTIRVTNRGSVDLHAAITDTLPNHVTPTGILTWTPTIAAPNGIWAYTFVVTVEEGYAGSLVNTAYITTDEGVSGVAVVITNGKYIYLPVVLRQ